MDWPTSAGIAHPGAAALGSARASDGPEPGMRVDRQARRRWRGSGAAKVDCVRIYARCARGFWDVRRQQRSSGSLELALLANHHDHRLRLRRSRCSPLLSTTPDVSTSARPLPGKDFCGVPRLAEGRQGHGQTQPARRLGCTLSHAAPSLRRTNIDRNATVKIQGQCDCKSRERGFTTTCATGGDLSPWLTARCRLGRICQAISQWQHGHGPAPRRGERETASAPSATWLNSVMASFHAPGAI